MVKGMVSCIIPTYKRSDTLIRAVKSVINQSYKNLEIIIVDDNEPNDEYSLIVQERLKAISDERIRYIQQKKHINGAAARNVGINAARGEFIAFLDDDDEWLPSKIEKQINKLMSNQEYNGITCLYTICTNGKEVRKCAPYTGEDLHRKVLQRSVSVCTPTVIFRKKCLDESGYFDETMLRHQDLQLLLDFLCKNRMLVLPEYLVLIHTDVGVSRPSADKLIEIKQHFFEKMQRHFESYDKKTQKRIYAAHYFEIVLLAMREKKIKLIIKGLLKIGFNPLAYYDLLVRIKRRR